MKKLILLIPILFFLFACSTYLGMPSKYGYLTCEESYLVCIANEKGINLEDIGTAITFVSVANRMAELYTTEEILQVYNDLYAIVDNPVVAWTTFGGELSSACLDYPEISEVVGEYANLFLGNPSWMKPDDKRILLDFFQRRINTLEKFMR